MKTFKVALIEANLGASGNRPPYAIFALRKGVDGKKDTHAYLTSLASMDAAVKELERLHANRNEENKDTHFALTVKNSGGFQKAVIPTFHPEHLEAVVHPKGGLIFKTQGRAMEARYGKEGFFPKSVSLDYSAMKLNELWDEHQSFNKYHIFVHDVAVPRKHYAAYYFSTPTLNEAKQLIKDELHEPFKEDKGMVASVIHHPDYNDAEDLYRRYTRVTRHMDDYETNSAPFQDPGMLNGLIVHAEHVSPHGEKKPGDIYNHKDMKNADNPYGSLFGNHPPDFKWLKDE